MTVDDLLNNDTNCGVDYSSSFWKTFMALCVENRETPAKVCNSIGVSNAAATKWKKGAVPSQYVANKIANHFNVDVDYLLKEDDLNNDSNGFYHIFTELCDSIGKSPSAVVQELGMNKSVVTVWKKNSSIPGGANLSKIAEYFNVSVDYLLGKEKGASSVNEPEEDYELKYYLETFKNRKEMRELFRVADKATTEEIKKAIEIIEILSR